jgi:DNA modification methylase
MSAKILKFPSPKRKVSLETNVIYCADNLEVMRNLPSDSIDLIYVDPPFFSGKKYETIWGGVVEVAYRDYRKGGIEFFVGWLSERLDQMHRLLKPTGSLFVHLDGNAVHYAKVALDRIFGNGDPNKGRKCFRNEIIWHYSGWNKKLRGKYESRHDSILFYSKSPDPKVQKFFSVTSPWSSKEEYVKVRKQKVRQDSNGREYVLSDAGDGKRVKRFLDEALADGRPLDDVWQIDKLNNSDKEKVGWDTQKPLRLIERIVQTATAKGDVVADFFCGCGTTVVAAHKLGRRYLGVDVSPKATKVIRQRLADLGEECRELALKSLSRSQILRLHHTEFEDYVVRCLGGQPNDKKVSDGGIDGRLIQDGTPIQVKQSEHVGRNVLDNFHKHLKHNNRGIIVAISFGKGAYEEQARLKQEGYDLQLLTLDDLLDEKVAA